MSSKSPLNSLGERMGENEIKEFGVVALTESDH